MKQDEPRTALHVALDPAIVRQLAAACGDAAAMDTYLDGVILQ